MRLESMDGWQYVQSTIYDMGISHAVHTMSSRSLLFATPAKFTKKVPLFFVDQGLLSSSITLPATGYFLQSLGLVPCETRMLDEVPWLLTFMSTPSLAAQSFCSLTESVSLSACFSGLPAAFNALTQTVANCVKDTDNLYIADWEQWSTHICGGEKLKVLTGECEEVDGDEYDGEDVGMETPSKKRRKASTAASTSATPPPPKKGPAKPKPALGSVLSALRGKAAKGTRAKGYYNVLYVYVFFCVFGFQRATCRSLFSTKNGHLIVPYSNLRFE